MKTASKPVRTKRRMINKAVDSRFAMRNQRPPAGNKRRGKSLIDVPDTPRRPRAGRGKRRTQLGISLRQGELAARDPVREK